MSHTITLELPDSVGVTLRGHARTLDTTKLPDNVIVALFEKGVQRGANDPLGAVFAKGAEVPAAEVDKYWNDLVERWESGKVQKTRTGGVGRTTDPVQREVKRLANAEIDSSINALLAHHGNISRKEFDANFRSKYLAVRISRDGPHYARLAKEAEANLAKLKKSADVELLDFAADESEDESEDEETED